MLLDNFLEQIEKLKQLIDDMSGPLTLFCELVGFRVSCRWTGYRSRTLQLEDIVSYLRLRQLYSIVYRLPE